MDKIRILLVDDHALLRAGLRALLGLEPDMAVVGEAGTGEDAIDLVTQTRPDVVLMDLSMPGMGGLAATGEIGKLGLGTRVLILTVHAEDEYLLPVLQAGGSGYVMKQSADRELLEAIRTVARGDVFLYPSGTRLLAQGYRTPRAPEPQTNPLERLSEREAEVLRLTAQGFSSTEVAAQLSISPKTVDTYRQRFMEKLSLHHRTELVKLALATGILTAE